jgi:beta-mannanase
VDNVAWVWCPTASGFANGTAAAYYPGDNEVNWVCADAYPGPGPYRSFATVVQPFLDWASHHRKPIMIGEYGVPDTYGPQQRAQWLWGAARAVQDNAQVKALVYFDANAKHAYALQAGSPALQAFRGIAHVPYFNPVNLPQP